MSSGGNWKELFNAAVAGDLDLVRYHVQHGVDIDYAHPEFLSTPLVACILAGQEAAAHLLLDSGAQVDLASEFDGMNPLQAARHAGLAGLEARLQAMGATAPCQPAPVAARRPPWWRRLWTPGCSA
ncbi:MAG: ankyrin repeat domain-containing protein [Burkholderiaceae bacterium]|nr:ankyrin repeat domain-containing protein [Burkholderiaceae bacterium]